MIAKIKFLVSGLFLCFCVSCAVNPITGEKQLMLLSPQQDIEIGRSYAPEIEKQMGGRIENAQLQNYIDNVGQKIARVSHRSSWVYQFVALKDESVNAFALPGGYVFITRGMLKQLKTEAQLAGILAHEVTHIVARHSSETISREIGIDILLSAVTSDKTPASIAMTANLTRQLVGLRYSREHEKQADLGGLDYMVQAGYNPFGMVETMQILEDQQQTRSIDFLSTHPSPYNRKVYLTSIINTKYYNSGNSKTGEQDYRRNVLVHLED